MKNYRRPSLKAVSTFEAAARHESFKEAAEELFLTPSAISHQVRQLENHLGVTLFHRLSGGLVITDAGAAYLKMLTPAFAELDEATKQVMQFEYSDQLTIRSAPSFAKKWLLHRLPDFLERHPDIDVKVVATSEILDFRKKNIDVGISYGQSNWSGYVVRPLLSERVLPMCSPGFKSGAKDLRTPADLPKFTLIHTERNLVTWRMWLADKGVPVADNLRGVCLDPSELAIEAAVRGVGVVLESDLLAAQELADGSLVPAFGETVSEALSYYLVYSEDRADIPKIVAFSEWISDLAENPSE
jgi:LysR family glycine cleavage system transcriptional activator